MKNIMFETLDNLYENGNSTLTFLEKGHKISFHVDRYGKLYVCINDSKKDYTEKSISICTAMLAASHIFVKEGTFKEDEIVVSYEEQEEINIEKNKIVISRIYTLYLYMLELKYSLINKIIRTENMPEVLEKNYLDKHVAFNSIKKYNYSIITIKTLLGVHFDNFTKMYKEALQAKKDGKVLVDAIDDINEIEKTGNKQIIPVYTSDSSLLKKLGISYEVLNEREYVTNPSIGREQEIRLIGACLLSPNLSPLLIGESGVGKTAIVDGLSYQIQQGLTSIKLLDKKILKISPSTIVNNCTLVGQFESKMDRLINFLIKNQDYILYMDEIHTAYGCGSSSKSNIDIINMLKPHLENGKVKLIGTTTKDEYNSILKNDKAFVSRLKLINVSEPSNEVLKQIVLSAINKYEEQTGIIFSINNEIRDIIVDILIDLTKKNYRIYNDVKSNPRLILSIIEDAFGYANYDECEKVEVKHIIESVNNCNNIYKNARDIKIESLNEYNKEYDLPNKKKAIYFNR